MPALVVTFVGIIVAVRPTAQSLGASLTASLPVVASRSSGAGPPVAHEDEALKLIWVVTHGQKFSSVRAYASRIALTNGR
jgi:hypothetical protein